MHYWLSKIVFAAVASLAILNVNSTSADDRFSVTIGSNDQLVILASNGQKAAELTAPVIGQAVRVGNASFQVSYGRDLNDEWSVIIAPSPTAPIPLSFTVFNNTIDSDNTGVVTLTFSKGLDKVTVDPGYVGVVKLNDARIRSPIAAANDSTPKPVSAATASAQVKEQPVDALATDAPKPVTAAPAKTGVETLPPELETPTIVPQLDPENTFWSEPVTPPDPKDLPQIALDEIKLLEIKGQVSVTLPGTTQEVAATEGMTIPSGTKVKTGPDGSVAAFLGGVNSARLMPETESTVNQKLANNTRQTLIDLKEGAVFSNVGRRAGETQDFKVKTPAGVAAAKGTAFLTVGTAGQLFVATLQGSAGVTDSNGNSLGTATGGLGTPGMINSNPGASRQINQAILASQLIVANAFNTKINALLEKEKTGTLTPIEKIYLANAPKLAAAIATIMNTALELEGFWGRIPPAVLRLIHSGQIPSIPRDTGANTDGAGNNGTRLGPRDNNGFNSPLNLNPNSLIGNTSPT